MIKEVNAFILLLLSVSVLIQFTDSYFGLNQPSKRAYQITPLIISANKSIERYMHKAKAQKGSEIRDLSTFERSDTPNIAFKNEYKYWQRDCHDDQKMIKQGCSEMIQDKNLALPPGLM